MRARGIALLCLAAAGCRSPAAREEGPKSMLLFEGTRSISERRLRRALRSDLQAAQEKGFRKADVDDLAFEVERFYRQGGYHFVRVQTDYSPARSVINVSEGPRVMIDEFGFSGNRAMTADELAALHEDKPTGFFGLGKRVYVEEHVKSFRRRIEDAYFERGFPQAEVDQPEVAFSPEQTLVRVSVTIREGPQYLLRMVDTSNVPVLDPKKVQKKILPLLGSAFVPRLVAEVRSDIGELYGEDGYPEPKVEVDVSTNPSPARPLVNVDLAVRADPGPRVRLRKVIVRGNRETLAGFVRSRVLLNPGEVYDGQKVHKSFRRLYSTGLFKTVDIRLSPPEGDPGERDLIVEVREGPTLEYFFEAGLGSYDLVRGKAGVRQRNLLGRGLIGRAEVTGSMRGVQGVLGVTDPWFLRTEWTADLPFTALYREEPSFTVRKIEAAPRISRRFTERLEGGGIYRFSISNLVDVSVIEPFPAPTGDVRVAAVGPFLQWDSRDDVFEPRRGFRAKVFGEVGGPYLGSEITFYHPSLSASGYLEIMKGTVLAANLETEWIVPFDGTDAIPIQERLFAGGENSVRSFRQSELGPKDVDGKPLGGEVRSVGSLELRQRIAGHLSGAIFGDLGNVSLSAAHPYRDIRPAVGFGLRYGLPIGPLRVDVGFNPDRRSDEDFYVIQFAVGMPY